MRPQLKNERGIFFLPHWDLNQGLLQPKASGLPMSYTYPFRYEKLVGKGDTGQTAILYLFSILS